MGWTFTDRDKGITTADFLLREFDPGTTFHASGVVDGVFYAAVESPSEPGEIWGLATLITWGRHTPNGREFGWKTLSETASATYAAPLKVLQALTPTDDPHAKEWRAACYAHHSQRSAMRSLKDGDEVILDGLTTYASGAELNQFTIRRLRAGRSTRIAFVNNGALYEPPKHWRDRVVGIIRDGESMPTPYGRRQDEDAYVASVGAALRENRELGEAVAQEHYGASLSEMGMAIRAEYDRGERFDAAGAMAKALAASAPQGT